MVELAQASEGVTARDIRRFLRSANIECTSAQVTGALRHFYAAGLAIKTDTKMPKWWPTPALFVAATTLVPDEVES